MAKRAEVEGVYSAYPASTYPAHTTLMTGCYPGKHGVFANFQLKTFNDGISHWAANSSWVYAEDMFAAAQLASAKLVDVAPTLAAVLGQTLADADGRVLTELLK